jgi:gluconokinase
MKVPGLRPSSDKVGGIVYFGRMLDKIRLQAQNKLPADYQKNLGTGFDGRCVRFLHIDYMALVNRVVKGGTDEEILAWCFNQGRQPNAEEIEVWNGFLSKRGWNDEATEALDKMKRERGFADRADIRTLFEFHKADEADE